MTAAGGYKQRALVLAQPLSAYLELTYRCNWRCVFCYNPRHFDRAPLSVAEWAGVLDELRLLGTLTVTLTGGEPLTHPSFFAIAKAARARAFAVSLFTNGALVDDATADRLAELALLTVEMSLHGARAETHDRATQTAGSHDALLQAVERLKARGLRVRLKTPVTRLNVDELPAMIALAERLGVPYHVDATITPRDDGDRSPLAYAVSAEGLAKTYALLAAAGTLPNVHREAGGFNCGLGRLTLAIDPEGNVYPCLQWRQVPLGNVRQQRLSELWRTSPERQAAAQIALDANEARIRDEAALSRFPFCPALALQRTGDPLTPDETHRLQAHVAEEIRGQPAAALRPR